jgi:hypothetical protein
MTNQLITNPSSQDQGSLESKLWIVDFTGSLTIGETISSAVVTLKDFNVSVTNYSAGLSGSATVVSPQVKQQIYKLLPGHLYLLLISVVTSLSNTYESMTYINCPRLS